MPPILGSYLIENLVASVRIKPVLLRSGTTSEPPTWPMMLRLIRNRVGKEVIMTYLDQDEWGPDVRDLITACPDNAIFDWKLMFRNPKPNWVSTHGCIVQLGDAAHTFLPSSGNGATQAMEDGISLASCLQLAGKAQIPLGVMVHNKLR